MQSNSAQLSSISVACLVFAVFCGCDQRTSPIANIASTPVATSELGLEFPDGRVKDVGEAWENTRLNSEFRIKNSSNELIRFRDAVTTTCGCTSGKLSSAVLQPGEVATLTVAIAITDEAGLRKQYKATIHREDVNITKRDVSFVVVASSMATWKVSTQSMALRVKADEGSEAVFGIRGVFGRPVALLDVESNISGAELEFEPGLLSAEISKEVRLRVLKGTTEGQFRLKVRTSDQDVPNRNIAVRIVADHAIRVVPTNLLLNLVDGKYESRVSVFHPEGSTIAMSQSDVIQVELAEPSLFENKTCRTVLTVRAPSVAGNLLDPPRKLAAAITVTASDGKTSEIPIKLNFQR